MYEEMPTGNKYTEGVKTFYYRHPVMCNIVFILIASFLTICAINLFLKIWTRHGEEIEVPNVIGENVTLATRQLESEGYKVHLDSIYDEGAPRGIVLQQSPSEHSKVKEGRDIYLRYACYSERMVTVPKYYNMSYRQARSAFKAIGIKEIVKKEVPYEFHDLVIAARYNGLLLEPGKEIPINAVVTIEVGVKSEEDIFDDGSREERIAPTGSDDFDGSGEYGEPYSQPYSDDDDDDTGSAYFD